MNHQGIKTILGLLYSIIIFLLSILTLYISIMFFIGGRIWPTQIHIGKSILFGIVSLFAIPAFIGLFEGISQALLKKYSERG